jgi:Secretion system C-terminal sorting domain
MFRYLILVILLFISLGPSSLGQPPSSDGIDILRGVCSDGEDGVFVSGHTSSSETQMVAGIVAHLDSSGEQIWTQILDFPRWDQFNDIALAPDGGCIIAGAFGTTRRGNYDLAVARFDALGETMWTLFPTLEAPWEYASAIEIEEDGSSWVAGSIAAPYVEAFDMFLLRVSADGDSLWSALYGDEVDQEFAYDLALTSDGGAVLVGSVTNRVNYRRNLYVVRVNQLGQPIWESILDTEMASDAHAILALPSGDFAIAGRTYPDADSEQSDGLLVMINEFGDELWRRSFGGAGDDQFHAIGLKEDGSFLLAGSRFNYSSAKLQGWLVLTDSNGSGMLERETRYGGDGNEEFFDLTQREDGTWIAVGLTSSEPVNLTNYYYVDDLQTNVVDGPSSSVPSTLILRTWPNPFNSQLAMQVELPANGSFDLRIYDVLGREVATIARSNAALSGVHHYSLDAQNLASGTYLIRARMAGSFDQVQRITLLK